MSELINFERTRARLRMLLERERIHSVQTLRQGENGSADRILRKNVARRRRKGATRADEKAPEREEENEKRRGRKGGKK